ncbi:MAG TPA: hypothetical protein VEC60_13855, partial [Reyranella sp.]|nr:hypothetical protein [Reyranella sp.]
MRPTAAIAAAAAALLFAAPSFGSPVADCPLRDAPFSIDSPLIDVLLSPAASGLADEAMGGRLKKIPAGFAGTEAPTFAAILTLREAVGFVRA